MSELYKDMEGHLAAPDNPSDSDYQSAQSARNDDEVEMVDIDLLNVDVDESAPISRKKDTRDGDEVEMIDIDLLNVGVDESAPVSEKKDTGPAWSNMFGVAVHTLDKLGKDVHDYTDFVDKNADGLELPLKDSRVIKVVEEIDKGDNKLWYRAQFGGGEFMDVPLERLTMLENGTTALEHFTRGGEDNGDVQSSSGKPTRNTRGARQRKLLSLQDRRRRERSTSDDEPTGRPAPKRNAGRTTRSQGLQEVKMLSYGEGYDSEGDFVVPDSLPRAPVRSSKRKKPQRKAEWSDSCTSEVDENLRRSGRSKAKASYVEPALIDDDFVRMSTEPTTKPKVVHSKEIFPVLDDDDDFTAVHNPHCGACGTEGGSKERGKLICCQGCSAAYHKDCIGQVRASREHLVTKISDTNFVLQCKRCIGRYRLKDPLQAAFDRCVDCKSQGHSCAPFRPLGKPKRANSDRATPDTKVPKNLRYNAKNVLFRCSICYRAWHYEHLPYRESNPKGSKSGNVRQARINDYTSDFKCLECLSAPGKISHIIAWRPADTDSRKQEPETLDLSDFNDDERQYLVKFEGQSYFCIRWVPGAWVAGAFHGKKAAFLKSHPPPIMTKEEAIEEDFLRVEILLDVEFSSRVTLGQDMDVDLARIKEVSKAYVKFKGLGYDEVFWEEPPLEEEEERWEDWRKAYDEFIHGFYVKPAGDTAKKVVKARETKFELLELRDQPKYIKGGTLMGYQKEGMNWLYYKWWSGQNAILADEMGLGKTIQIISFLAMLQEEHKIWPFLIVVPHSTVPNWKREIQHWCPASRVVAYYGAEVARKISRKYEMFTADELKCHIVVTSYRCAATDAAILRRIPWQGLIVDEGQRLKNDETQLYAELQTYSFNHKVLLTGTPLQNNPRELFNLLQFLDPKEVNAQKLEDEFADLNSETVRRLHEFIRPYFLRRTKAQVLTHLPPMAEVIVPVSMSAVQKKLYRSILSKDTALIRSILYRGDKLKNSERAQLNNLLMQLRKCVCHPFLYNEDIEEKGDNPELLFRNLVDAGSKLSLLNIMLPKLKERGHRVLLFSQFLGMLDITEDFLNGLGLSYQRLDGSISTLEKQKRIDAFNAPNSKYFAFLLSTRAGGVGINLATADTVIILDPDFNPHQDIQALSRAHRIGQKNKVLVFHLMTRDTVEERIMQIGKKKLSLDHLIIEKMGGEGNEDEAIDVESILKFGAKRLFDDDGEDRAIKYDDESVDKLLDRSKMEQTKTTDDSTESVFGFARVWANDRGILVDTTPDEGDGTSLEIDFWEKVLREREEMAGREAAAHKEELGRGRRRTNTSYNAFFDNNQNDNDSDTDFQAAGPDIESTDSTSDNEALDVGAVLVERGDAVHGLSSMQCNVAPIAPMMGVPAHTNDAPEMYYMSPPRPAKYVAPPVEGGECPRCRACKHRHRPGDCAFRQSGIQNCPLCGLAHLPASASGHCTHLQSETQIEAMMAALRESTEDTALVAEAMKILRENEKRVKVYKRVREVAANAAKAKAANGAGGFMGDDSSLHKDLPTV